VTDSWKRPYDIAAEAAEWHLDMQCGELSAARRAVFVNWLARSPAHVEEFLRLVALQADLKRLPALQTMDLESLLAQAARTATAPNVVDFPGHSRRAVGAPMSRHPAWARRTWLLPAAAVSLLAALFWFTPLRQWWTVTQYQTGAGGPRSVSLRDGSQVQINVRSDLEVQVDGRRRDVQLLNGEALFQVAHDPAHPFRVHTPQTVIEAKGTQFDVRVRDGRTVVVLLEGRVEVAAPRPKVESTATGAPSVVLKPGEAVTVMADTVSALQPHRADVDAETAWVRRRLVFDDTPLERVVDEFNLYSDAPIVIDDPAARSIRVSASFDAANPELFARSVAAAAALKAERHADGNWHIERP